MKNSCECLSRGPRSKIPKPSRLLYKQCTLIMADDLIETFYTSSVFHLHCVWCYIIIVTKTLVAPVNIQATLYQPWVPVLDTDPVWSEEATLGQIKEVRWLENDSKETQPQGGWKTTKRFREMKSYIKMMQKWQWVVCRCNSTSY